jgi:hypothetical protein
MTLTTVSRQRRRGRIDRVDAGCSRQLRSDHVRRQQSLPELSVIKCRNENLVVELRDLTGAHRHDLRGRHLAANFDRLVARPGRWAALRWGGGRGRRGSSWLLGCRHPCEEATGQRHRHYPQSRDHWAPGHARRRAPCRPICSRSSAAPPYRPEPAMSSGPGCSSPGPGWRLPGWPPHARRH